MTKNVYDLKLHESIQITTRMSATRVPGGWLYRFTEPSRGDLWRTTTTFVPFNDEFTLRRKHDKESL